MSCVRGGYKTLSPIQICNALGALQAGVISLRAFRVFFGCTAALAAREAAGRVARRARRMRSATLPRYQTEEIARLTRCGSLRVVRSELRRLEAVGLLQFSPEVLVLADLPIAVAVDLLERTSAGRSATRPIPIPRPILRLLARPGAGSTAKVILAHCVRGLALDRRTGEVRCRGTVKASWIADTLDMSLRAVRSGRAELVRLGLIARDTGSSQWKLNRDGSYFTWNLNWSSASSSAPRCVETASRSAPPMKRPETPYGSKRDQEPVAPGAFSKPDIRNVNAEDLRSLSRLDALFQQAVSKRILGGTESDVLNFVSAAVRALSVKCRDPERVFMGIVRKKLWGNVTQAQEERALAGLDKIRRSRPDAFSLFAPVASRLAKEREPCEPSMDRRAVRAPVERSLGVAA